MESRRRARKASSVLLTAALLYLALATTVHAAPSVFWNNYEVDKISRANLAGGSGFDLPVTGTTVDDPYGLAIDAAAGQAYWTNFDSNSIGHASLDGAGSGLLNTTGATLDDPSGPSIDPAAGRIYWANANGSSRISYANLSGGGGGVLNIAGATTGEAYGVVVSPRTGRIYWGDYSEDAIDYANLDGSGGGVLNTSGAVVNGPVGLAIDSATNRIFWANYQGNTIAYANLGGGGGGVLDTSGALVEAPNGLAVDIAAGRIYWANASDSTIYSASLNGGSGAVFDTTGATAAGTAFPVLIEQPRNATLPTITGQHRPGTTLACSNGTWADQSESFLALAPQSYTYQWFRNGHAITGATAANVIASKVGAYSCGVTATNFAGSVGVLSGIDFSVNATVGFKKVTFNRKKGTATLRIALTGAGRLDLFGKGVANVSRKKATGTVKLVVRSSGKARIKLKNTGKAKVKATVSYTPEGGKAIKRRKTIVLKKKLRH
jgi:DNA-binding beta-propeller fold protein YncE